MPRTARAAVADICYHVINRGNRRACVFHDDQDYRVFASLMRQAIDRIPMRIVAWCLMPNHFHFVLWPTGDGDLGRWMHWLMTSHVRRHHRRYGTDGRIWQGRFKAFPIEMDSHLRVVMRYVERNPLSAQLVDRAEHWRWSSLGDSHRNLTHIAVDSPLERGNLWTTEVNEPVPHRQIERVQESVRRSRPFGSASWTEATAHSLGLESSLGKTRTPRR